MQLKGMFGEHVGETIKKMAASLVSLSAQTLDIKVQSYAVAT